MSDDDIARVARAIGGVKMPPSDLREMLITLYCILEKQPRSEMERRVDFILKFCSRAAIDAMPSPWRGMDSAPKDGMEILAISVRPRDGNFAQVVSWDKDRVNEPFCWETSDGPVFHEDIFTHWQPILPPSPPAPDDQGAE